MSDTTDLDKDLMDSFLKDSYKIFINMRESFKEQPDKAYYYFNLYLNDFDKFKEYIKSDNLDICKDILKSDNQDIYKVINDKNYYSFVLAFSNIFKLKFNYNFYLDSNYEKIEKLFKNDNNNNNNNNNLYSSVLYNILDNCNYFTRLYNKDTISDSTNNCFIKMIEINDICNKDKDLQKEDIYNILFNQIVDSYSNIIPTEMNFLLIDLMDDKNTQIINIITHHMLLYEENPYGTPENNNERKQYVKNKIKNNIQNLKVSSNTNDNSSIIDDDVETSKFITYILLLSILFNLYISFNINDQQYNTKNLIKLDDNPNDYVIRDNIKISNNTTTTPINNSDFKKIVPDNTYFYLNFNYFENIIKNNDKEIFNKCINSKSNNLFYEYNNLYLNNVFYELFEQLIKDNVVSSFDYEHEDLTKIFEDKIITNNDILRVKNTLDKKKLKKEEEGEEGKEGEKGEEGKEGEKGEKGKQNGGDIASLARERRKLVFEELKVDLDIGELGIDELDTKPASKEESVKETIIQNILNSESTNNNIKIIQLENCKTNDEILINFLNNDCIKNDYKNNNQMKNILNNIINIDKLCNKHEFNYELDHKYTADRFIYSVGQFYKDVPLFVNKMRLFHMFKFSTVMETTSLTLFAAYGVKTLVGMGIVSGIFTAGGIIAAIPLLAIITQSAKKIKQIYNKRKNKQKTKKIFTTQKPGTVYKFIYFYENIKFLPYIYKSLYEKIESTLNSTPNNSNNSNNSNKSMLLKTVAENNNYDYILNLLGETTDKFLKNVRLYFFDTSITIETKTIELYRFTILVFINLIMNHQPEETNNKSLLSECLEFYKGFIKRQSIELLISSSFLINLTLDNDSYKDFIFSFFNTKEKYCTDNDIDYITLVRNFIYNIKMNPKTNVDELFNKITDSYKQISKDNIRKKIKIVIDKIEENKTDVEISKSQAELRIDKDYISKKSGRGYINFTNVYDIDYEDDFLKVSEKLLIIHEELLLQEHSILIKNLVPIVFFIIYKEIYDEINFEEFMIPKPEQEVIFDCNSNFSNFATNAITIKDNEIEIKGYALKKYILNAYGDIDEQVVEKLRSDVIEGKNPFIDEKSGFYTPPRIEKN